MQNGLEAQANLTLCAAAKKRYTFIDDITDAMTLMESEGALPEGWEPLLSEGVELLREARGEK